jgi:hypothetical protein
VVLDLDMASPQQVDLSGVTSGEWLLVETDNEVQVGVNSDTALIPVGSVLLLGKSAVTSLYLQNTSTTIQPVVQVIVVD